MGDGNQHRDGDRPVAADCGSEVEPVEYSLTPEPRGCAMPGCCAAVEIIAQLRTQLADAKRELNVAHAQWNTDRTNLAADERLKDIANDSENEAYAKLAAVGVPLPTYRNGRNLPLHWNAELMRWLDRLGEVRRG